MHGPVKQELPIEHSCEIIKEIHKRYQEARKQRTVRTECIQHLIKGYRQPGRLQGAFQTSLCPCLCFSRPGPPKCLPSKRRLPYQTPPSASSIPLYNPAATTIDDISYENETGHQFSTLNTSFTYHILTRVNKEKNQLNTISLSILYQINFSNINT